MTKFQVGDEVEITEASIAMEGAKVGGVASIIAIRDSSNKYVVTYEHNNGWKIRGYSDGSNLKRLSTKPTKNQRISALEKEVAELKKVVEDMQKPSTLTEDIWDFPPREIAEHPTSLRETVLDMAGKALDKQLRESVLPQSNNQKRVAIIKKAKQFVEENDDGFSFETVYERAVVALKVDKKFVRSEKGELAVNVRTGVSVCHPHDVFNQNIGEAIALGRALGLDVSEFEQAVQPDEVVVGMITYHTYGHDVWHITNENIKYAKQSESVHQITNDTNAQYEEVK